MSTRKNGIFSEYGKCTEKREAAIRKKKKSLKILKVDGSNLVKMDEK